MIKRVKCCFPEPSTRGHQILSTSLKALAHNSPHNHIPRNELDKVIIEGNASPSIKGGRVGVTVEIAGDNLEKGQD
jgi:hypothetical protein